MVTLILVAFAAVGVFLNVARIDTEIRNRLDNALQVAQIALPTPLATRDNFLVDRFLDTLFLDESVVYVSVYWEGEYGLITRKARPQYRDKITT